jgi:hypothetical protein
MADYEQLMSILSVPRPNGSRAEQETRRRLQDWLAEHSIPYRLYNFPHYPYFFECIGIFLISSRLLLALAIWLRWGWPAFIIALASLLGATIDQAFHIPLVTWPGRKLGQNILIELGPDQASRELILSAHYDSKTELLDHNQRMFFLKKIPLGIALTLLLGLLGLLDGEYLAQGSHMATATYWTGVVLSVPLLFLAGGLGLNLSLGRLVRPSQGAVDNGAACAILLGLAERWANGEIPLEHTRLTLALFTGEEVNLQGSRAYARGREYLLPTMAINLEIMAQNGAYVYWERDGSVFKLYPTSEQANQALRDAVREVTRLEPQPAGPVISDGGSFISEGIPTAVLGTHDIELKDSGFHRPADNLGRVVMARLPEGVEILTRLLHSYDQQSYLGKNKTKG